MKCAKILCRQLTIKGTWNSLFDHNENNMNLPTLSEESFSNEPAEQSIKVSDRAAIVNLMIGLDGYTISSGIFPKYLQGEIYVEALKQYHK